MAKTGSRVRSDCAILVVYLGEGATFRHQLAQKVQAWTGHVPSAALPKLQASQGLVDHPQHPDSAYRFGSLRFAIKSTKSLPFCLPAA
jgi:hypothetical protein